MSVGLFKGIEKFVVTTVAQFRLFDGVVVLQTLAKAPLSLSRIWEREMNRFLKIFVLVASLQVVGVQVVEAATLFIDPNSQSVVSGSTVSVDVNVGVLGDTQVGAYDFILSYDPSLLTFASLSFGSYLGYDGDPTWEGISYGHASDPGALNVWEVSQLLDLSGQPTDTFKLFSVMFNTKSSGTASLSLSGNILGYDELDNFLGDADGNPISLASIDRASIDIQPNPNNIPEPSSLLLMGLGFAFLRLRYAMVSS